MPDHDVLVIGAGLAGQRAALAAAEVGASVGLLSKVHPVRSHSNAAQGGINAALNPEDSWESHAYDTVKGSDYLGDQDAIEVMCKEAPSEILTLEHLGVTFHRNEEGRLGTRAFGGASQARTYYVADITGQAILHVLYEQLMKHHERLDRYEEWFTIDLLQDDDDDSVGAICRNLRVGHLEVFNAMAVLLASGGADRAHRGPGVPRRHGRARHHQGPAQADARGPAGDRQYRPRLRRRRHHARADPHQARQSRHHGRCQDRHSRPDVDPGALRSRRGGLRLRSRRQP